MTSAVVFAYHNVGVRCLKALLGQGIQVPLVVTHDDNPNETIWFASVASTAREYGLPVITPHEPNTNEVLETIKAARPDFIFSFYYRHLLKAPILAIPGQGAYNMHGSMLPKYRGRVPINWAIIHGEAETGATLHVMNTKPDNGPIIDQQAVPILPDDTALDVFAKVTVAAEMVLVRALPALVRGEVLPKAQDLSQGAYFSGRTPEDGRIDGRITSVELHNFVRALTRPFPGAFVDTELGRLVLWKTHLSALTHNQKLARAHLKLCNGRLVLDTVDGACLYVIEAELNGNMLTEKSFVNTVGALKALSF